MDTWLIMQAIFIGIVEGVTEFLPISSTGHIILFVDLLGFKAPPGKVFEIVIQLGSILALCWYFRKKIFHAVTTIHSEKSSQHLAFNVLIAFLPAMIIGALMHGAKESLFTPEVVAIALLIGGIIILLVERRRYAPTIHSIEEMGWKRALVIGFFQCIALIPGVSRSGATIVGSLLLGLERKTAAEFSFFLSIPTMLAATVYSLYSKRDELNFDDGMIIAVGFISAFISALLIVKWLMTYISKHDFKIFGYYRIALGGLILVIIFLNGGF